VDRPAGNRGLNAPRARPLSDRLSGLRTRRFSPKPVAGRTVSSSVFVPGLKGTVGPYSRRAELSEWVSFVLSSRSSSTCRGLPASRASTSASLVG